MQTTELMIGNLLRDKLTGEWLRVEEIKHQPGQSHLIGYEVINREKYPLPKGWSAEPITLNRDVMKLAGFTMAVKDGHTEYTLKIDDDRDIIMHAATPYSLPYIPTMPHIKYLHQVQNLARLMANVDIKIAMP